MLLLAPALLLQITLTAQPPAPDPEATVVRVADSALARRGPAMLRPPRWDQSALYDAMADTLRRRRAPLVEYSEVYQTRGSIHRVLSYAMVPLFLGSGYTGFQLRNKGDAAPQWVRDAHGPLAAGTAVVFGMNTLTGVWNLWEGRKDPDGRGKRLLHGALFLTAAAGFTYVTAAGDNIQASGRGNHWHRDVALASMSISVVSWSLMMFR